MKKIIRLMPCSIYDVPALENWFSEQSEKGLFLQSANWIFASFSKDTPQKKIYRLEVITGDHALLPQEQLEAYQDFGWEFVTSMSGLFHIFSNTEEIPIELHTDPIVQGIGYEKIAKRLNHNLLSACIITLYLLWLNYKNFKRGIFDLTAIVEQNLIPFLLASFLSLVLLLLARLFPYLQIRRQLKTMQNGAFPREQSRKVKKLHSGYLHLGILLCFCVMLSYSFTTVQRLSAEEYLEQQGKLPFITLEEIEGLPAVYPIDYSKYEPTDYPELNDYLYYEDHSMLAPKQFILRQDEAKPVRDVDKPAYLWMKYAEVSLSALSKPYFEAQIKDTLPEGAIPIAISEMPADTDQAEIYQYQGYTYIFLRNETETLCVHHHGTGDLLPYLERFVSLLQKADPDPFLSE